MSAKDGPDNVKHSVYNIIDKKTEDKSPELKVFVHFIWAIIFGVFVVKIYK